MKDGAEHKLAMGTGAMRGDEFRRRAALGAAERERLFREHFDAYARPLFGRFRAAGMAEAEAQDHVQIVFERLCRDWQTLQAEVPPIHWMNRVASNAIIDFYRRRSVRMTHDRPAAPIDPAERAGTTDDTLSTSGADADPCHGRSDGHHDGAVPSSRTVPRETVLDAEHDGYGNRIDDDARQAARVCTYQALSAFEKDAPDDARLLGQYATGELSVEDVRACLGCPSVGAARERISQWRKRLSTYCLRFCETPDCS